MEINLTPIQWWQNSAINNPFTHFSMYAGVSSGKTFAGAHYVINQILQYPHLTGLIGANDYNQLSAVALRETFYWLNEYGFEYVCDRIPPTSWGVKKQFKDYSGVLSVRNPWTGNVTTIFIRVMSNPNALRGLEFSWYWLDEIRDMKQETHDVVLSRLRESDYIKGLLTTTTNGNSWDYKRFCTERPPGTLYGSMHVKTYEAVRAGIISEKFYCGLKSSYSELMAAQELDAQHVNVYGGRAYYAAHEGNKKNRAPWAASTPDPSKPLIVGCDFNFDPAPFLWVVGQQSPDRKRIHWFKEVVGRRMSTTDMTKKLVNQFPGFYYRVFGDRSGMRGTTSNAGKHDYNQMAEVFNEYGCHYSIDSDQGQNPVIRDRVENVNRLLKNGMGEVLMTYDPHGCPHVDADLRTVGWRQDMESLGKLDDGGDKTRTHATDAIGYAVWKMFPPGSRGRIIKGVPSLVSKIGS